MHLVLHCEEDCIQLELERLKLSEFMQWRKYSLEMRTKLGMPKGFNPWTDGPGAEDKTCALFTSSARVPDCLNIGYMLRKKELAKSLGREPTEAEVRKGTFLDISQNCHRMPMSKNDKLVSPTTKSMHYSFEHKTIVRGRHHMAFMGWPTSMCDSRFSDRDCRILAGDGLSAPLACLMSSGCFLNPYAPWWRS